MSEPFGRRCEHGLLACHSWACYEEEYGESREELMGERDDYRDEEEEPDEDDADE